MPMITIRPAADSDLPAITAIYNHYVRNTIVTFDLEPFAVETRREWFSHYRPTGRHRCWVAERESIVVGYATSSRFRPKDAYLTSIETSIYLHPDATSQRIGGRLYERLFADLATEDVHRAYAGISLPNDVSVAFHERFGFQKVAVYSEVGRKFDRYWDVMFLEKKLGV